MKEHKKAPGELYENELEQASGGGMPEGLFHRCFFLPTMPIRAERRGSTLWVHCRSRCHSFTRCSCHGQPRCVDKMHEMFQVNENTFMPAPLGKYQHAFSDKTVTYTAERN